MMCTNDIKIIDVISDYCIQKRQYSYKGVYHISLHCNEYHTRHFIFDVMRQLYMHMYLDMQVMCSE